MTVDPVDFREAMRNWATGVTVVATVYEGVAHGMTVNSFTSVSLTPPLVLVSLERTTRTHGMVEGSGIFGITILAEDQQEISDCFAGRQTERSDRFDGIETFTLVTGAPFIRGGLAFIDCRVTQKIDAATHTLYIAEVVALELNNRTNPLLYYNRSYRHL